MYTNRHLNVFYCNICLATALAELLVKQWTVPFEILENQGLIFTPFDLNLTRRYTTLILIFSFKVRKFLDYCIHVTIIWNICLIKRITKRNINCHCFSLLHSNVLNVPVQLRKSWNFLQCFEPHLHYNQNISIVVKDYNVDQCRIQGYNGVHRCRPSWSGGGVSWFIQ